MTNKKNYNLGIMFRREHAPENLPDFARRAEDAGFDELWVVEDCFYTSGIALSAAALACTERISVGLGIMPAVVRNPVFTAMEIATLAGLYPGRFLPGLGHGVTGWMHQIGAFPKSQLRALEETTVTVRNLLAGERFSYDGTQVHLDDVELVHPPEQIPPISLGVRGPKSLNLSGRVADGTILAEYASPAYVTWAREQIQGGQQEAGVDSEHRLTVFAWAVVGETTAAARQKIRSLIADGIASGDTDMQLAPMGILSQVHALKESVGPGQFAAAMPDEWIDALSVTGTPENWQLAIDRLVEAGADTVVLLPLPDKGVDELDVFAQHYLL
jgi:5,10-methylenetetrahydromethanopterin reductase